LQRGLDFTGISAFQAGEPKPMFRNHLPDYVQILFGNRDVGKGGVEFAIGRCRKAVELGLELAKPTVAFVEALVDLVKPRLHNISYTNFYFAEIGSR
jgi:hypothetical protein